MASKPTQRTLDALRKDGWTVAIVERWNAFAGEEIPGSGGKRRGIRQDLFNCIDILAMKFGEKLIGIQSTSGTNHAARRFKAIQEPRLKVWLGAGCRFEIWSWSKRGAKDEKKKWSCRREAITLDDLPNMPSIPTCDLDELGLPIKKDGLFAGVAL
jgi:hypothetical protein